MSMVINGVTLDHDMYWEDEFKVPYAVGTATRTIDGTVVIQQAPLVGGRLLTLTGDESHGWQSRTTVQALMALTAVDTWISNPFNVVLNGVTYVCLFRFEEEPSVSFTAVTLASNPSSSMWYYGTIKLRIVA